MQTQLVSQAPSAEAEVKGKGTESGSPMRLLQAYKVYRPDANGGVPEVISQLTGLRDCGDDVSILVARTRGLSRHAVVDGTPVAAVSSFGELLSMPMAPTFPVQLWRAARDCDVLAVHTPFPLNDLGVFLGLPDRVALVVHWHAQLPKYRIVTPLIEPFAKRMLARADRIIVSDPSILTEPAYLASHAEKSIAIPYGVEVDYWSTMTERQRAEAEQLRARHPRLIISTGRLVSYKGYPVLLEAMRRIEGELVIVGEGRERERLLAMSREFGIADRVIFKGYLDRDQLKTYLHAARLFVLSSVTTAEAFGIVQIEAMAAGLPVVNTDLPTAVPTIARDNIEGFTVPAGDPPALAAAIGKLLDETSLREQMSVAARRRAVEEYSRVRFLTRIRSVYAEAVAARAHRGARQSS